MISKSIRIYGDSVMRGTLLDGGTKRYKFNSSFLEDFKNMFKLAVSNRAKFGCTVTKGFEYLKEDILAGLDADAALLEYGGNDCDFNWGEIAQRPDITHQPHTPPEIFAATLKQMIGELRQKNVQPVIMSLPPINSERYFDWFTRGGLDRANILKWLGDLELIYRHQELYSLTATRIALESGCRYVDVRSYFLAERNVPAYLCEDGIHPNEKGYELIKRAFIESFS